MKGFNFMSKLIGNAIVGQSGGPTSAINATLSGVIKGAAQANKEGYITKLYGMRNGIEGMLEERMTDLSEIWTDEDKLYMLENTPAAALGSCRKKLPALDSGSDIYAKILEIFKKYNIRYFFYIGGNDSMDTVSKLAAYSEKNDWEMRVIGVPKTIDNDLIVTDHTPGFGSAAKFIATCISEVIRDSAVYPYKVVTIVEIMGRDAGWLTSAAALPRVIGNSAPDYIYLPERNFDMDAFFADIEKAFEKHPNVVVAVSEGIHFADGTYVGEGKNAGVDMFGHKQLSGTANALAAEIKNKFGCKVRNVELSSVQRCAAHCASLTDLTEAVMIGKTAVKKATDGLTAQTIVAIRQPGDEYKIELRSESVHVIANAVKHVPDEFINAEGNGITDACIKYLLPLIQGEVKPVYENGMPKHFIFD